MLYPEYEHDQKDRSEIRFCHPHIQLQVYINV